MKRNPVEWLLIAVTVCGAGAWAASKRPDSGAEVVEAQMLDAALLARPGVALKEALRARDSGNAALADALFAASSKQHPLVADYADRSLIELKVAAAQYHAARALS